MQEHFDAIVLGVGGVGSAALYHLASRGARVLGIDRFAPGHDRGSSHGQTRAIRKAYFEHPSYVPLLHRAYENWHELEAQSGKELLHEVGLLEIGPPQGALISGVRRAARQYALPLEELPPSEVARRFPGFRVPPGSEAVFEPDGGYLSVEECVTTHVDLAQRHAAQLISDQSVRSWSSDGLHVSVQCAQQTFHADRLIVTAGAWASDLLNDLGIPFRVLRKHLHWYATHNATAYAEYSSPVFFYETPAGYYYGFPQLGDGGVKVAEHSGGEAVENALSVDRTVDPDERRRVEQFVRDHLPGVSRRALHHTVCMYTMSPDEHFVVDRHPRYPNVSFAAGLSGHGFKFASVLGEVLCDLTMHGATQHSIEFLSCKRWAQA